MGAYQSTASKTPGEEDDTKRIHPYGVTINTKSIKLNRVYRDFYNSIVLLGQSPKFADLVISCADKQFLVHRAIVCTQSAFFSDCIPNATVIGERTIFRKEIHIDSSGCSPAILAAVLSFLYTLDYKSNGPQTLSFRANDGESITTQEAAEKNSQYSGSGIFPPPASTDEPRTDSTLTQNELIFHAKVFLASKMFKVDSLADISKERFDERLRWGPWEQELLPCIEVLYSSPVYHRRGLSELRKEAVKSARSRFAPLKGLDDWSKLVRSYPAFTAELLERF